MADLLRWTLTQGPETNGEVLGAVNVSLTIIVCI